jgi:hypothetical protein
MVVLGWVEKAVDLVQIFYRARRGGCQAYRDCGRGVAGASIAYLGERFAGATAACSAFIHQNLKLTTQYPWASSAILA